MPAPDQIPDFPALRLLCIDASSAAGDFLRGEQVDVRGVEGRTVIVPTDSPGFAFELGEIAESSGWAHDPDVCRSVGEFLDLIGANR